MLDSTILSEPTKANANPLVLEKLKQFGRRICTAPVVMHEMRFGVARLADGKRKAALISYLNRLLVHPITILPYDAEPLSTMPLNVPGKLRWATMRLMPTAKSPPSPRSTA